MGACPGNIWMRKSQPHAAASCTCISAPRRGQPAHTHSHDLNHQSTPLLYTRYIVEYDTSRLDTNPRLSDPTMADGSPSEPSAPSRSSCRWPCQWRWMRFLAKCFLALITAPYRRTFKLYTWKPLRDFRRTDCDPRDMIPLVRDWKVDKYAELQSVQVAVSRLLPSWNITATVISIFTRLCFESRCLRFMLKTQPWLTSVGFILCWRHPRYHIVDQSQRSHLGFRRSLVLFSHLLHLGRHNVYSNQVHPR